MSKNSFLHNLDVMLDVANALDPKIVDSLENIELPDTSEGVYDPRIDSYRHRAFNYFTDIICNRRLEELDVTTAYYRRLKDFNYSLELQDIEDL